MPRSRVLVLAIAAAVVVPLAACGDDDGTDTASPTPSPSASTPTAGPTTAAPEPSGTSARPVYWLRDTDPAGPRLYREFVQRPETDAPAADALEVMFAGDPADADYTSLWPAETEVLSVVRDGDLATVDLSREALDGQGGAAFEAMSVQQLVHTVTAAEPDVARVALRFGGQTEESLWGHADVSEPLRRAPAAETLAPVWILTPTEGGTIARGAEFGGEATVFEATVSWEWAQNGTVVAEGFSTASEGAPGRGPWTATVDVPPGEYVLRAFESSAEDGRVTFLDTKRVTVTG